MIKKSLKKHNLIVKDETNNTSSYEFNHFTTIGVNDTYLIANGVLVTNTTMTGQVRWYENSLQYFDGLVWRDILVHTSTTI